MVELNEPPFTIHFQITTEAEGHPAIILLDLRGDISTADYSRSLRLKPSCFLASLNLNGDAISFFSVNDLEFLCGKWQNELDVCFIPDREVSRAIRRFFKFILISIKFLFYPADGSYRSGMKTMEHLAGRGNQFSVLKIF
ncbi:MAG: hypothetical protein ABII96_09300 [Candidatus Zixiibacteriota bacterium]